MASERAILAREREAKAFEMRKAGHTFQSIADELGITEQGAEAAVKRVLARLYKPQDVQDVRALELARCDALQKAHWVKAEKGRDGSTDRVLKVMERRARLTGVDAPTRSEAEVTIADDNTVETLQRRLAGIRAELAARGVPEEPERG